MYRLIIYFFLCFKQKTAYDMRISDWSSDVCSSDLLAYLFQQLGIAGDGQDLGHSHGQRQEDGTKPQSPRSAIDEGRDIGASAALAQRGIGGSEIAEPRRFLEADIVGKDDDRIGRRDHIFTQAAEWILVKHRLRGGREPEIALQDKGGAGHRIALATGPAGAATAAGIDIDPVAGLQAGHCGTDNAIGRASCRARVCPYV